MGFVQERFLQAAEQNIVSDRAPATNLEEISPRITLLRSVI